MIILGIDPGIASVGYGVVNYIGNRFETLDYGTFHTPAGQPLCARLAMIYDFLNAKIAEYDVKLMAVEELFFNTNTATAISVGHARGVILLAGQKNAVSLYEFTPLQVKQAVVGYGRAEKKQVQEMTRVILGLKKVPRPDDTADALALAICCAHSSGSKMLNPGVK